MSSFMRCSFMQDTFMRGTFIGWTFVRGTLMRDTFMRGTVMRGTFMVRGTFIGHFHGGGARLSRRMTFTGGHLPRGTPFPTGSMVAVWGTSVHLSVMNHVRLSGELMTLLLWLPCGLCLMNGCSWRAFYFACLAKRCCPCTVHYNRLVTTGCLKSLHNWNIGKAFRIKFRKVAFLSWWKFPLWPNCGRNSEFIEQRILSNVLKSDRNRNDFRGQGKLGNKKVKVFLKGLY